MSILDTAPRGGVAETLGGARYVFMLRNAEIERFEDEHRGVYALWDSFYGAAPKATSAEIKDLLALGLVGGGMDEAKAQPVIKSLTPADLMHAYKVAQAVLGVAFMPEVAEVAEAADDDGKKDQPPTDGMSGG